MKQPGKRAFQILLAAFLAFVLVVYWNRLDLNLMGVNQGYTPVQPIAYSHRLHAGDLQIACQYCHVGASQSRHAGIPDAGICMNCHKFVSAGWESLQREQAIAKEEGRDPNPVISPELQKIYSATGFNLETRKYDAPRTGPIEWVRVHNLQDFVYFDHRPHVNAGVACQQCHGPVESMERVQQYSDLAMGWCVNCHRDVNHGNLKELKGRFASTDCGGCHY